MDADEFLLDTPVVRAFVQCVRGEIAAAASPADAVERLRPSFDHLLRDPDWLPDAFAGPAPDGGMGGGIGQWLLFRAHDRSLSLFTLVVAPGAETPVHDHLAWGLVGLYRGRQDEEVFAPRAGGLELLVRRPLVAGSVYPLLPPREDVHRVRTTSGEPSVSLHLLTNDTGCVWRHAFDPRSGAARPFRSGYANVICEDDG